MARWTHAFAPHDGLVDAHLLPHDRSLCIPCLSITCSFVVIILCKYSIIHAMLVPAISTQGASRATKGDWQRPGSLRCYNRWRRSIGPSTPQIQHDRPRAVIFGKISIPARRAPWRARPIEDRPGRRDSSSRPCMLAGCSRAVSSANSPLHSVFRAAAGRAWHRTAVARRTSTAHGNGNVA